MDHDLQNKSNEKLADKIRGYCKDRYIIPAREKGEKQVTIRVGDVHKELNLTDRYGSVDDALGANKFQSMAKVKNISSEGPSHAPNKIYKFQILT